MRIELISQSQYDELKSIHENHPKLVFQNDGYEYIDKRKLSEDDVNAFNTVTEILKKHIYGFCEFNNFLLSKKGRVLLRLQYNYNYDTSGSFNGVGYILLDELLNGFEEK